MSCSEVAAPAEEDPKCLIEQDRLLVALLRTPNAASSKNRRAVPTPAVVDRFPIASSTTPGPTGMPGRAQRAGEDRRCSSAQPAVGLSPFAHIHSAAPAIPPRTWFRISLAFEPSMRAMSSWYLSRTPSVSDTVAGSSATRVELDQRLGPVEGLGDAGRLEQVRLAQRLHESNDLLRQFLADAGHLGADDLEFARRRPDSRPSDRGSGA